MNKVFEDWQGAVIYIEPKVGEAFAYAAAHVFETVDGLAFVGPGHLFQDTAHLNNFHRFAGELSQDGDAVVFSNEQYTMRIEEWEASIEQQKQAGTALHEYESTMAGIGETYASQRAAMLAILRDEIGKPLTDA